MHLVARRTLAFVAVVALVAGTAVTSAAPARAAVPHGVVIDGTAGTYESHTTIKMTVRPWQLFGQSLGLGTISGTYSGVSWRTDTSGGCLFGLAWGITITETPKRSVTYTCLLLAVITNPVSKVPVLAPLTVTATDGPEGSFDINRSGPDPEIEPGAIHVTFF